MLQLYLNEEPVFSYQPEPTINSTVPISVGVISIFNNLIATQSFKSERLVYITILIYTLIQEYVCKIILFYDKISYYVYNI